MKIIQKISLFLALFTLNACFDNEDENTWIVATSADNPPYEYMQNGELVGFDIDLMNTIGSHLGKKIEFKNMDFHGIIAALSNRNVDMAIAGMSITPKRRRRVDFSIPYTGANVALLYKRNSRIEGIDDFNGKIVGSQLGTVWSEISHILAVHNGYKPKSLASNLLLIEEMKIGRIDAMILEESQAAKFKEIYPQFDTMRLQRYASSFAIALPKKSPLKTNIDHTLESLQENGTIDKLEEKWGVIDMH